MNSDGIKGNKTINLGHPEPVTIFKLFKKIQSIEGSYEPIIENRYPDFIIIAPTLGVLVVEVKEKPYQFSTL